MDDPVGRILEEFDSLGIATVGDHQRETETCEGVVNGSGGNSFDLHAVRKHPDDAVRERLRRQGEQKKFRVWILQCCKRRRIPVFNLMN